MSKKNLRVFLAFALLSIVQCKEDSISNRANRLAAGGPRIVVLGATGVGKSTLANVLLGRDKNFDGQGFDNGCFKVSVMNHKDTSMTKEACHDQGHWIGNRSLPVLTVIDTPGFGNNLEEEQATIESLVSLLRDEIKSVDVFVLAFRQQDNRMSPSLRSMIGLIQKMFGNLFWNNVILEATHWNYDSASIKRRHSTDKPMTEGWWANEFNLLLSKDFGVTEKIPAVFIDSFHNVENDFEVNKFRENVEKLRLFAETRKPFECKDIQTALSEIHQLQQKVDNLKSVNRNMSQTISDLTEKLIESQTTPTPQIWKSAEKNVGSNYCLENRCFTQHQFAIFGFLIFLGSLVLVIVFALIRSKFCFRESGSVEDGLDKRSSDSQKTDRGGFESRYVAGRTTRSSVGLAPSASADFQPKQNTRQSQKPLLATQI